MASIVTPNPGTMSATVNDTGKTAGSTYTYRIVARVGSGGQPAPNSGGFTFTGKVEINTP